MVKGLSVVIVVVWPGGHWRQGQGQRGRCVVVVVLALGLAVVGWVVAATVVVSGARLVVGVVVAEFTGGASSAHMMTTKTT